MKAFPLILNHLRQIVNRKSYKTYKIIKTILIKCKKNGRCPCCAPILSY